jgi:hypothetical protein
MRQLSGTFLQTSFRFNDEVLSFRSGGGRAKQIVAVVMRFEYPSCTLAAVGSLHRGLEHTSRPRRVQGSKSERQEHEQSASARDSQSSVNSTISTEVELQIDRIAALLHPLVALAA